MNSWLFSLAHLGIYENEEWSHCPRTAGDTITFLRQFFKNRLIALGLSATTTMPHDLKQEVSDYLQAVPHETYRKVGQNLGVRINACLNHRGAHIENVNYKDFVQMPVSDLGLSLTQAATYSNSNH